jgi:uncharacterized membrane protein
MIELITPYIGESIGLLASLALIASYHVYLRARLRRNPNYTIQAINHAARASWVEYVMANNSKDILAVQTLRNSTMAATFLASTAILLIIGVLNLSQHGEAFSNVLSTINPQEMPGGYLWSIKLLPLMIAFFWSFFCFTLAVRMFNHVGYLINSVNGGRLAITPLYVSTILNRGGSYYSLGMRSYYMSVPLVFWLFGPGYIVLASIGLITVLYHIDRSPKVDQTLVREECKPLETARSEDVHKVSALQISKVTG